MPVISIEQHSGVVQGSIRERALVSTMRAVAPIFRPFGYRGYSRACQKAADLFMSGHDAQVRVSSDTKFSFPINDPYWIRLITRGFQYEPELERILLALSIRDYTFLDCGANFGYWSCLVSSRRYGSHRAIAVEPSSTTFSRLEVNAHLNADRFSIEKAAVSDVSGAIVHLGGPGGHAAKTILTDNGEPVETITIDGLIDKYAVSGPIIIKLDVEGVEIDALKGASRAGKMNPLILYEDHGNDPTSKISAYLLDQGWKLYHIEGPQPILVKTLAEINAAKPNAKKGYNFAAVRQPGWL